MASEEQVLQEIHFREMLQDLKESVQGEVSAILDKKLKAWQSSLPDCDLATSERDTSLSASSNAEQPPVRTGRRPPSTSDVGRDTAASWSPGFNSALERTNTLTRALTRSHSKAGRGAGERVFVSRPSLLTELLQVSHIHSLYNIFVAILCLLLVQKLSEEVISTGRVNLELSLMAWCFGQLDSVIIIWLAMFAACSVGLYSGLHCWANNRYRHPRSFDIVFGTTFLVYLCLLLYLPASYLLHYDLPLASSFIVLCEQVRFFMKSWAFVRSNLSRALRPETHATAGLRKKTDDDVPGIASASSDARPSLATAAPLCPNFSQHLYFLFAPTLVYRDDYPKSSSINWGRVSTDLCQVVGCIFYTHFLFVRFCVPVFQQFGKRQPFSASQLLVSVFSCCFPASLVLLCAFFAVLHAWMNAFAEMMRFSDRMFYKDWWNSTSYARFYRTWNCVVHDWLYEYVYRELHTDKTPSRLQRYLPLLLVFLISSVVHEYILAIAFRFFYPVLLFMFGGFGVVLMFIKTRARQFNVFLWVSLILGTGILMCLYSLEWYARRNCAPVYEGFADYLVPRSWFCESLLSTAAPAAL